MTGTHATTTPSDRAATRKVIEENNTRFTRAHADGDIALVDASPAPTPVK